MADDALRRIEVVAAVIEDGGGRILATCRGYGPMAGGWEFPGGKIEAGETPQAALRREIREELASDIIVGDFIMTVEHDYPDFHLTMHCYRCQLPLDAEPHLLEHSAARWLTVDDNLPSAVEWLPADFSIFPTLMKIYRL